MSILSFLKKKNKNKGSFLVLDIGSHSVKTLIVRPDQANNKATILGAATQELGHGDVKHGQILNIFPVVEKTSIAIDKATQLAGFQPDYVIAGISSPKIINQVNEIIHERKKPESKISPNELSSILDASQKQIKNEILGEDSLNNDIELINASVLQTQIDDVEVKNPLDFIGKVINLKLYSSFAPCMQINALQSVADNLKLNLISTVNQTFALYKSLTDEMKKKNAIIIDIGEDLVNLLVVKDNTIFFSKTIPIGGSEFTKVLSKELDVTHSKANQYKSDYADNLLTDETSQQIKEFFDPKIENFNEEILALIQKNIDKGYPQNVYFTGGGALLPGLIDNFKIKYDKINKVDNKVSILKPSSITEIDDQTGVVNTTQYISALSIVKLGMQFGDYDSTISNFIKKLYQTLRN